MEKRLLTEKVAVVTGSTSGIGKTVACRLASAGAKVVISGRREERGKQIVEEICGSGGQAFYHQTDLTEAADCHQLCETASELFGGLDILVNNAAIYPRNTLENTSLEEWDQVMAVNLRAPFLCSQKAVPLMRKREGGCIINIGTTHNFTPWDGTFAYSISKGGLYTMTRKMAYFLRKDRIRVNWITVGWVLTEKEWEIQGFDRPDKAFMEKHREVMPLGSYNTEEEIAEACVYLAGDNACRITGTDLNISAGLSIQI